MHNVCYFLCGSCRCAWLSACLKVRYLRVGLVSVYWFGICVLVWYLHIGLVFARWFGICVLVNLSDFCCQKIGDDLVLSGDCQKLSSD